MKHFEYCNGQKEIEVGICGLFDTALEINDTLIPAQNQKNVLSLISVLIASGI